MYPSIYLSIHLSIHPFIHQSIHIHLSIHSSIYLSIYLYIYPSIHLFMHECMHISPPPPPPHRQTDRPYLHRSDLLCQHHEGLHMDLCGCTEIAHIDHSIVVALVEHITHLISDVSSYVDLSLVGGCTWL